MGVVHKVKRAAAAAFESRMAASTPPPPVASAPTPASKYPRFGKRGAPQAFPSKLYEILEGENPDIVGWTATGRGFEVRDHARLSSEVLGRFFKQDKFSSFQRQLNLYGFRKITKGSEAGSYQHPHFRRGERTTLLTIRRSTKASPARVVVPSSPASPPAPPAVPLTSAVPNKPRSATPSPPPAPVSHEVLPWPRPPITAAALHSNLRGVSPDSGSNNSTGVGRANDGHLVGADAPTDRQVDRRQRQQQQQQQQPGVWVTEGGVNSGRGSGWGYVRSAGDDGNQPASPADGCADDNSRTVAPSGDCWKETEIRVNAPEATGTRGGGGGGAYAAEGSRWGEKEPEKRVQGLDHQDVEVVGLLQRMAKEAQDSPSRKKAASSSMPMEEERKQDTVGTISSHPQQQQQQQQPEFRMSRPPAASDEAQQGQPMVFAERLYDIINHERVSSNSTAPSGFGVPFAVGVGGRAAARTGFPNHHRPTLPAPFPTSAPSSSSDGPHTPRGDSFDSTTTTSTSTTTGPGHRAGQGQLSSEHNSRRALLARWRSDSAERRDAAAAAAAAAAASYNNHGQHQSKQQDGGGLTFEPGAIRPTGAMGLGLGAGGFPFEGRFGSGPSPSGSPLPRLNFNRNFIGGPEQSSIGGGGMDSVRHGGAEMEVSRRSAWQRPDGLYSASPSQTFGTYPGDQNGNAGGGAVSAMKKAEGSWAPHHPFESFEGGRRVVN